MYPQNVFVQLWSEGLNMAQIQDRIYLQSAAKYLLQCVHYRWQQVNIGIVTSPLSLMISIYAFCNPIPHEILKRQIQQTSVAHNTSPYYFPHVMYKTRKTSDVKCHSDIIQVNLNIIHFVGFANITVLVISLWTVLYITTSSHIATTKPHWRSVCAVRVAFHHRTTDPSSTTDVSRVTPRLSTWRHQRRTV